MESMTDEQLIDFVRQGDERAYRVLMERHQKYIYTLIYRMIDHRETAEDLTQEVFIKLYRSLANFRGESQFTTWLYRLTVNLVTDYRRSQKRRPHTAILDVIKGWFGDRKEEPEARALRKEEQLTMQQLLSDLPDKYRLILYLYHYKQLSYQEISDICGLPLKTIETRLYRGKTMLKEKWMEVRAHEQDASGQKNTAAISE
ncbi:RNA polymerase sigma factor [Paenibacillus cremeus]|uniref:RNA polymerase sigma factor n=1 Tax=Paenibacillus cremeus TaxID=2163881 RepID=A0A559JMF6_9BACL|nr:RNA polymerase sigma factor [Paenibacillus cremeus]TVY01057.1 RNA polymerase sigma factor [Paenibacillus cremeus]